MLNIDTPWKNVKYIKADPIEADIDELASIRAELDKLKVLVKREKELTDRIKDRGAGEYRGRKCIAEVVVSVRHIIDNDAVKRIMGDNTPMKDTETRSVKIKPLM